MPNFFAYVTISVWPLFVLWFINRYGFTKGALLSLLGAYMFLPAGFEINLPGIPAFTKFSVTSMTFLAYMLITRRELGYRSLNGLFKVLIIGFIIAPFFTVFNNPGSYLFLPGLSYYDGLSDSVGHLLYFLPFLIGFKYFRNYESQYVLFKYFAIAAVIYAILALYEVRMSPQLHNIFYGFFPSSWLQQVRSGGFRAIVFMGHGLLVALFLAIGLGVWAVINKNKNRFLPVDNKLMILLILIALIFMKSFAALIFGLFLFIMITFISTKKMHQASVMIAMLFMTYPITSSMGIFPHDDIVDFAYSINPERGQSLEFRFKNENMLLDRASIKPFFGWGGWGRNRVLDPETGEDLSVTDGKWILTIGIRGWFGFLTEFLLIVLPIWMAYKIQKKYKTMDNKERALLAAHALIVSIILLDQMPNASLNPLYLLLVGSLLGRVFELRSEFRQKAISEKQDLVTEK